MPQYALLAQEPLASPRKPLTLPASPELPVAADSKSEPSEKAPHSADPSKRVSEISQSIESARYNLTAMVASLGEGVDPAFNFVRDHIAFESYRGVLHGAWGAYRASAGNALDRSLLLAEILRQKHIKTRFAMGQLKREAAEKLFEHIFQSPRESRVTNTDRPGNFSIEQRIDARARRDYAVIRAALGKEPSFIESPKRDEVLKEIAEHAWVQAEVEGKWIDLDTAFADAKPGQAFCDAAKTPETVTKDLYQSVTIRVIVETLSGTSLKTQTALEATNAAEKLLDREIVLIHTPPNENGLAGTLGSAGKANQWKPVLWLNGKDHPGKPVVFDEQEKKIERGKMPTGGLFNALGTGTPALVAEWLEFEVNIPGGGREVTRRALVDRAGAAWRQSEPDSATLRPLPKNGDGLTSPREIHNIWFTAGRHDLATYAGALQGLLKSSAFYKDSEAVKKLSFPQQIWPFVLQNFSVPLLSDHLVIPAVNDSPDYRFYCDSPRIYIFSVGPAGGEAKQTVLVTDLRRDHVRGLARNSSAQTAVIDRKIWFGAVEGALEHEASVPAGFLPTPEGPTLITTSALLTDEGAATLRPADASRGGELASKRETAARLILALRGGNTLVVPKAVLRGGTMGWWEVAGDGSTRAVLAEDLNGGIILPPGWKWPKPASGPMQQIGPHMPSTEGPIPNPDYTPPPDPLPGVIPEDPPVWEPTVKNERKGGGNEYMMMVGFAVGMVVVGFLYAYYYEDMVDYLSAAVDSDLKRSKP